MARLYCDDGHPADAGGTCPRDGLRNGGKSMFTPRGFYTSNGFVGFLPDGSRIIFPTYDEYLDYIREGLAA